MAATGSSAVTLATIEQDARAQVDLVADDPAGRLALRRDFYRQYGAAAGAAPALGYGTSEVSFLEWEIARGVLDPVGPRASGGSAWWRAVNLDFLYFGQMARLAHERELAPALLPWPAQAWLTYISAPGAQTWYRAHNACIVAGYVRRRTEAKLESREERVFLNMVLYRLLYAQGLVEGVEMGRVGRLLANPELPSVEVLVHLPDFYPRRYPLTDGEYRELIGKGHGPEEWAAIVLDDLLICPQLRTLYQHGATWCRTPELLDFVKDGEPTYPDLDPHAWHHVLLARVARLASRAWSRLKGV